MHRDIKHENVMLDSRGGLKLVDFGLAKDLRLGPCTLPRGTPMFMAPELFDRRRNGYGTPADLWACGLVLHFMSAMPTA